MFIMLVSDDSGLRERVALLLKADGHQVYELDTSNPQLLNAQISSFNPQTQPVHLIILDGHNRLRDADGKTLIDMKPFVLTTWLRHKGIPISARLLIYSGDEELLKTVRQNPYLDIWRTVSKKDDSKGLNCLVGAVRELAYL